MVRIRFRRVGAKRQASYRIVAADRESPRDGRFLEVLGFYNPRTEPATVQVDERRLFHWMKNGARPSDAVHTTLTSGGTWERWERYKQGEALEALIVEAEKAWQAPDPRTRRDDLASTRRRKRQRTTEEAAPKAAADAQPEPDAPAEAAAAPAEAEVEAESMQAEAEPEPEVAEVEAGEPEPAEPEPEEPATADAAAQDPEAADTPGEGAESAVEEESEA